MSPTSIDPAFATNVQAQVETPVRASLVRPLSAVSIIESPYEMKLVGLSRRRGLGRDAPAVER